MYASDARGHGPISFVGALLVAAPAVFVYFAGWSYLNYYLGAFGVGVAELDISAETILVYAVPASLGLLKSPQVWGFALATLVLLLAAAFFDFVPNKCAKKIAEFGWRYSSTPWYCRGLAALVLILFVSTILVRHVSLIIREAALTNVAHVWDSLSGVRIRALAKVSTPDIQNEEYATCKEDGRLLLIFSDRASYYMLCPATIAPEGQLYEVRRDSSALISVRRVGHPRKKDHAKNEKHLVPKPHTVQHCDCRNITVYR